MKRLSRNALLKNLANPKSGIFTKGRVLSAKEFVAETRLCDKVNDLLGDPRATTKTDLLMLTAYTMLNTHLAPYGLHIKSRNYYSEFYVVSGTKGVSKAVKSYLNKATNSSVRGESLLLSF